MIILDRNSWSSLAAVSLGSHSSSRHFKRGKGLGTRYKRIFADDIVYISLAYEFTYRRHRAISYDVMFRKYHLLGSKTSKLLGGLQNFDFLKLDLTERVSHIGGWNFRESQLCSACFNKRSLFFCSPIREWDAYANEPIIVNKDSPIKPLECSF